MLLLADWVIPVSSAPLADAGVRVAEGRIIEVGPAARLRDRYWGEEVRDFPGCALLPGFVNAHSHLELSVLRGFARPSGFGRWMLNLIVARRKLDRADFETSALWGAQEAARCGITSLADTAFDGVAVAKAAAAAGLRARVYQEVFGLDDASLPRTMERYEAVMERLQAEIAAGAASSGAAAPGFTAPPIEAGVSPHAPYTVSARLYHEAARFARRAGLRVATHVAESAAEVELLQRGTGPIVKAYRLAQLWTGKPWRPRGVRPVEYVAGAGALSPETLVIHAVEVNAQDVAILAASGAAVAHCPRSNARLRCAVAPVADLLAAGVTVGLGTDSLASNDSLDMFAEMRAALAAAEARVSMSAAAPGRATPGAAEPPAPAPLTAEQVLRMATLEGARALGWGDVTGSLEVGKSADVIAVRMPVQSSGGSPEGVIDHLVFSSHARDLLFASVAGRVVFDAGVASAPDPSGYLIARRKLGLERTGSRHDAPGSQR